MKVRFHYFISVLSFTVLLLFITIARAQKFQPLPENCWGVYSWATWDSSITTRKTSPLVRGVPIILRWSTLEPEDGKYKFKEELGNKLKQAEENGFYIIILLWVGPESPAWIYKKGVPIVKLSQKIKNDKGSVHHRAALDYPYYFDKTYMKYFFRVIQEFGDYVNSLPDNLHKRIIFIQPCEGSTGDGYCYKGVPLDAKYNISFEEWGKFRIKTWEEYKKAFQDNRTRPVRLLVNDDSSKGEQHDWLLKNLQEFGCKKGMSSHGYHISEEKTRLTQWRAYYEQAVKAGKFVFTRGEQDAEWARSGWSKKNPGQSLYWSAIYALHSGLDLWNLPFEACLGDKYSYAIKFFNKYAGRHDPSTSPAAFCALRQGLDAADTSAFPESRFGKAQKKNIDRYLKIVKAFSSYGAMQGDPKAAIGGGMVNRKRKDYNDAGWDIFPGNFGRFLEQAEPEKNSAGWWHVEPKMHIYSRFARGFENKSGKKNMYFRLDDRFFKDKNKPQSVKIRVVYLDKGNGTWSLCYYNGKQKENAYTVTCEKTGNWLEKEVVLKDAYFNHKLPESSDLMLSYLSGDDVIFHLIELDRR